jgi:hypothetical protein
MSTPDNQKRKMDKDESAPSQIKRPHSDSFKQPTLNRIDREQIANQRKALPIFSARKKYEK